MATAAQIQAESWWQREIVTVELDWLGDELCRRTGRPRDAAGTKGNTAHLNGAHRSQEWLLNSIYCTNKTYTIQPGLTGEQPRHIAGFDFTPGNVTAMIAQSRRLIAAMKAGLLDEVLAIYCNVDGDQVVDGWNNVLDRAATSDSSHLWHWHLTLDRRHMTNRALMERIVAITMGDTADMSGYAHAWIETGGSTSGKPVLPEYRVTPPTVLGNSGREQMAEVRGELAKVRTAVAALAARPPVEPIAVTDEQLERVLRKVLGMAPAS